MPAREMRRPWHRGSAGRGGELSQQHRWGLRGQASSQESLAPCTPCATMPQGPTKQRALSSLHWAANAKAGRQGDRLTELRPIS